MRIKAAAPLLALILTVSLLTAAAAHPAGAGPAAPQNPHAGPDGTSNMHGDSVASDTTAWAGPGANARAGLSIPLPAVCPTILTGKDGIIQALCTEYVDRAPSLYLIDPDTWLPVARHHLEAGSLLGGVYAYIDDKDRLVTVDGTGSILWLAHSRDAFGWSISAEKSQPVDLPGEDAITTVGPGYDGHVWFATAAGRAGYATASGDVRFLTLGRGDEQVANSIATAPSGTAITTDHATYLVRSTASGPKIVWRQPYDRGPARKPGQLSWGSGSTPTFFGPSTGSDYVVITDNARPQENLLVYRTGDGRQICSVPTFGTHNSGTENSPVAWNRSVYLASTYGYPYPAQATENVEPADPATDDFVGGFTRIDVVEKHTTVPAVKKPPSSVKKRDRHHHRQRARAATLVKKARAAAARATTKAQRARQTRLIRKYRKSVRKHDRSLRTLHRTWPGLHGKIPLPLTKTTWNCRVVWETDIASAAVPRLSRAENVLYTVKRSNEGLTWELARLDPETGAELSLTPLGTGPLANTLQMVGTILPDGTLLQGTLSGLIVARP